MSVDRGMDKEDVGHICTMEYYSAIKKNGVLPFVTTWMGQKSILLSEISQTEKDKCCMFSLKNKRVNKK